MWAIIGGTGFEKSDSVKTVEELNRETPFGLASPGFKKVRVGETEALFIPRHGSEHTLLPSEVNFRANIFALKKHGASKILSFSAVGSLTPERAPGTLVIPSQYIDRTKGIRKVSFFGEGIVGHVSLAHPTCGACVGLAKEVAQKTKLAVSLGGTCVIIEGPAFSTQAESHTYRAMGASIIGMTAFPEYALAREAGLCFLPCAFVTDYDCWDDSIPHVTVKEVMEVMHKNNLKAYSLAHELLKTSPSEPCTCLQNGMANAFITAKDQIPTEKREWLAVLGV